MTNADWIRGMTDEELARYIINPCNNLECGECTLRTVTGKCILNSGDEKGDGTVLEWLERERGKRGWYYSGQSGLTTANGWRGSLFLTMRTAA